MSAITIKTGKFEFAEGARFQTGAERDPQVIGERLEALRKKHRGELTPEDVVADARPKSSPLHSFFEWSDTKAAEAYRLAQARGLIRSVVVTYTNGLTKAVTARAFVHIDESQTPHYRSLPHALAQENTRRMVLQRAWREFQSWRHRYEEMKEFATLFEVADQVGQKLRIKG